MPLFEDIICKYFKGTADVKLQWMAIKTFFSQWYLHFKFSSNKREEPESAN